MRSKLQKKSATKFNVCFYGGKKQLNSLMFSQLNQQQYTTDEQNNAIIFLIDNTAC